MFSPLEQVWMLRSTEERVLGDGTTDALGSSDALAAQQREPTHRALEEANRLLEQQAVELRAASDLLERRTLLAEQAQLEAEAARLHLDRTFSQAPVAVAVLNGPTHVFTLANDAYSVLAYGRPLIGLTVREALPELEGQGLYELLDAVYASGERTVMSELRLQLRLAADQPPEERIFDFTYQPLRDPSGDVSGIAAVVVDVTDKVAAREVVAESERQLRTLANAIPTLAWTARPDGFIDWFNARWYEYTGTTLEEMAGWGWQSVHDPAHLPSVMEKWSAGIASGEPVELIFPLRGADGKFRQFLTRVFPVRDADGRVLRWFGTNTDVDVERTAREDAERAADRTERLQALTEALASVRSVGDVARVVVAEASVVMGASTAVLALRERGTDHATITQHSGISEPLVDEYRSFDIMKPGPSAESLRTGASIFVEAPDGPLGVFARFPETQRVWDDLGTKAIAAVPLLLDGEVIGAMTFTFTEPRAFTPQDRAFFMSFAHQCAQAIGRALLIDAERAAREEAEAANRSKSQFLAAMSHELRTPLNAIGGYAQIMELEIHGPVNEAQRAALGRIQHSQAHLLSVINDVLNFAKIEAGRLEYHMTNIGLADVLTMIIPLIEPQLAAKHITHEIRIPRDVLVYADREKLQQILLNLYSNSVKFTDPGGSVTVDVGVREGAAERAVFIRVCDTGIGIPRDKQHTIFDPFVQVHRNLTRSTEGTGLGLAISRDLARGMGGDLRVRSEEGQGSTFTLTLERAV
jgi:PAS domain S-box-containing protein